MRWLLLRESLSLSSSFHFYATFYSYCMKRVYLTYFIWMLTKTPSQKKEIKQSFSLSRFLSLFSLSLSLFCFSFSPHLFSISFALLYLCHLSVSLFWSLFFSHTVVYHPPFISCPLIALSLSPCWQSLKLTHSLTHTSPVTFDAIVRPWHEQVYSPHLAAIKNILTSVCVCVCLSSNQWYCRCVCVHCTGC